MPITDFHNHVMPGVDDGARTPEESAAALAAFAADGVVTVVATPHIDASLAARPAALGERLSELDAGWDRLSAVAADSGVTVLRGAEVALDTPEPDFGEARLRLAGTSFVLVEFAFMTVPPNPAGVLRRIRDGGWIPVLAHPERYGGVGRNPDMAREWSDAGALLQINGASLLGRYGAEPAHAAQQLLARGSAAFICSDYHCRTGPWIRRYRDWLLDHGGGEQARLLLEINPRRLLEGELPLAVPPLLGQLRLWQRVRSIFH